MEAVLREITTITLECDSHLQGSLCLLVVEMVMRDIEAGRTQYWIMRYGNVGTHTT